MSIVKTSSFSCAPTKILLAAVSFHRSKVVLLFDNGFLRVCPSSSLIDAVISQKDLIAIASLKTPMPHTIDDIAWSLEENIAENADSEYLYVLSNSDTMAIYFHKAGYNLTLFATFRQPKMIDSCCWNKGDLTFVCCYQDGSISLQRIDQTQRIIEIVYTINLSLILDEACLRLSCPLPNYLVWEGTQSSMILFDLSSKTLKAASHDFAAIPLALAGKFNETSGEEFYCEKNWVKAEDKPGTLIGVSSLNGTIICPNYFSVLKTNEELLLFPVSEFDYKLTQDQVLFLQSSGKAGKLRMKNHVEVIEWSTFIETQEYFVTYDVADQLILWKHDKGNKAVLVCEGEVNGVGMIMWIDYNKILTVQKQNTLTIIEFHI